MKINSILFVCLGNICRSPTAEAVFRKLSAQLFLNKLIIDSAGTSACHVGEHADSRAIQSAKIRGYDLSKILSRQVEDDDFKKFDLIVVMDKANQSALLNRQQSLALDCSKKIQLFLDFSKQTQYQEVPDPYYGGDKGFDLVIDLVEDASHGLIDLINKNITDNS